MSRWRARIRGALTAGTITELGEGANGRDYPLVAREVALEIRRLVLVSLCGVRVLLGHAGVSTHADLSGGGDSKRFGERCRTLYSNTRGWTHCAIY